MPQTVKVIRVAAYGGPEAMQLDEVAVGEPGPGEIRIRHHACGLNFIDVYQRTGLYANPLPLALGMEGAGVVEAVGEGVTHLKAGRPRRLREPAAGRLQRGARDAGQVRVQAARRDLLRDRRGDDAQGPDGAVPAEEDAAARRPAAGRLRALPRRGRRCRPDRLPVGQGARPAASSARPAATRSASSRCEHGAAFAINYQSEDFVERVKQITGGQGAQGGLRLGGQGHLRSLVRLPAALRPGGQLRQRLGQGAAGRDGHAGGQGLAVRDATDAVHPHRHARVDAGDGRRPVRGGAQRRGEDPHRSALCA